MQLIWGIIKFLLKLIPNYINMKDEETKKLLKEIQDIEKYQEELKERLRKYDLQIGLVEDQIAESKAEIANLEEHERKVQTILEEVKKRTEEKINEIRNKSDGDIFDIAFPADDR